MTPEVAETITLTFVEELAKAKVAFQAAQTTYQEASGVMESASIRLVAIEGIKDHLLQFPDIVQAFKKLNIPFDRG